MHAHTHTQINNSLKVKNTLKKFPDNLGKLKELHMGISKDGSEHMKSAKGLISKSLL